MDGWCWPREYKMMKSRTMWFSFLLVIFGALMDNLPALQSLIDPKYYGIILTVVGIITAILRFLTTKPLE
jgi:hypothetical protein